MNSPNELRAEAARWRADNEKTKGIVKTIMVSWVVAVVLCAVAGIALVLGLIVLIWTLVGYLL